MREWDIPVLFQVSAESEDDAAEALAFVIGHWVGNGETLPRVIEANSPDARIAIESWHMPNHQSADGSDNPVRVIVVPLEPAYSDRQALVREITRLVQMPDDQPSDSRYAR